MSINHRKEAEEFVNRMLGAGFKMSAEEKEKQIQAVMEQNRRLLNIDIKFNFSDQTVTMEYDE